MGNGDLTRERPPEWKDPKDQRIADLEERNRRLVDLVAELAEDYEYRSAHGEIMGRLEVLKEKDDE